MCENVLEASYNLKISLILDIARTNVLDLNFSVTWGAFRFCELVPYPLTRLC